MFKLKPLSKKAIPAALEKARHYRLLNEPAAAESICLDVLAVDPENQEALIDIVLAMADRFGKDYAVGDNHVYEFLPRIKDEYARTYYTGIVYERRAKAILTNDGVNAFEMFEKAMDYFERAEAIRPLDNDDAILRWNGCARIIIRNKLEPREMVSDFIE
ncbi:MAG TPA: hypothetical protein VEV84_01620 [Pyrinomonadaceae bacterium]|nr:hypothetical protein [Pyrinomonadaceae bacterium]